MRMGEAPRVLQPGQTPGFKLEHPAPDDAGESIQPVMAMAMIMATGPASNQSIIRVTYTSDGMHTPTSMMRMMSISTQPPKSRTVPKRCR